MNFPVTRLTISLLTLSLASAAFSQVPRAAPATPFAVTPQFAKRLKTRNLIFISTDGLRWQEVFHGAQDELVAKAKEPASLRIKYWRDTPEARRRVLMPFFWSTIATQGQLFGNRDRNCFVNVGNGKNFSYPGYDEFLTGFPDPNITSNKAVLNPNPNVLEWLNTLPPYKGKVAAYNCWNVLPSILGAERNHLPMWTEGKVSQPDMDSPTQRLIASLIAEVPSPWEEEPYDAFVFAAAHDYLKSHQPRVFYVNFGETDEWAHGGDYTAYLNAANRVDRFVSQLWQTVQAMPQYRDKTTFVITTDHGRGRDITNWGSHGASVPGADEEWVAVLGPDTSPQGERSNLPPITLSQVTATLAGFLGQDYPAHEPRAAAPIAEVFPGPNP